MDALKGLENSLSGYLVSRLEHSLQSATHAYNANEPEEMVVAAFHHRRGAGQRGIRVFQIGGRIDRTANFAVVAVLVFGVALGAFPFDETVRQKHVFGPIFFWQKSL